jgi:signal transduction histidine kinase
MWPRGRPRDGWAPGWLDVAIAVPLTVFAQTELLLIHRSEPVAVALSMLITGALLWRSRAPVLVALVAVGAFGIQAPLLDPAPQVMANGLAVLVAVYSAFALAGPKSAAPVLLLAGFSFVVFEADQGTEPNAVGDLFATIGVAAIGWFVWRRHHQIDDRLAAADAELHLAGLRADAALAEERRRIARELHDVVSHAVTVVVLQARGGRSMLTRDPEQTRAALDAIELSGQDALAEMRRLVTLLREPMPDTAPQPRMSDLDALVAEAAASGAHVDVVSHGDVVVLSPGIELTAYRLVQEALTNALNHAPGTPVQVEVGYGPSSLALSVSNPVRDAVQVDGGGYGLLGMRERVELYGGVLEYGQNAGVWTVRGTLPYAALLAARGVPPVTPALSLPTS